MASISMAPNQRMYQTNTDQKNNESSSMIPQGINGDVVFSRAEAPNPNVRTKNPNHIFVNAVGTYSFLYESTASLGGTTEDEIFTFGISAATLDSPIRLDIQPTAWSGSSGLGVGDVTFVYRGQ